MTSIHSANGSELVSQPNDALPIDSPATTDGAEDGGLNFPTLEYWLVTSGDEGSYTPFQGFGLDITDRAFLSLVEVLALLPASIPEVFVEPDDLPDLRQPLPMKRSAIVGLPSLRSLANEQHLSESSIHVFLGLPEEISAARSFIRNSGAIFVSTSPSDGVVSLEGYSGHAAQFLDERIRDVFAEQTPEPARSSLLRVPLRSPFAPGTAPSRVSGVTAPNERLSASLGYSYSGTNPIDAGQDGAYEEAVVQSADQARTLIGRESTDLILYAPSIVRHLYAFGSAYWNNLFRRIPSAFIREVIRNGVFRNKGYSGFRVEMGEDITPENPYDDPIAGQLLRLRQIELRLTTLGVAALASSGMQPALRLPNAVNFHGAELREIEQHADRADTRGRCLLQANYKKLAANLGQEIGDRIIAYVRQKAEAITVVADAPIEWVRVDGVPLMIRHEVSRIGTTPGNLMLAKCVDSGIATLPAEALLDILVIRSFSDRDPVRPMLEGAIGRFDLERVRVSIVDVERSSELVERLNAFEGAIVVFDCHGGHDGENGHGWLRIGTEKVDTWQLAHVARVPPIVILSACSTFALAGSHASVGNGLLRSGAITVVGTLLPVNAAKSAIFVARLLYRIDAFLPALRAIGTNFVTWRSLVSTFLQMSYATDVRRFFQEKQWILDSASREIGVQANRDINSLQTDWYERLIDRIAQSAQRTVEEVSSALENEAPLQETMYYCQIGRPETLGIYLGE